MTDPTKPTPASPGSEDAALLPSPPLGYFPVGLFGAVMGLTGLSIAWRLAHTHFGTPEWIATVVGIMAVVTFVAVGIGYVVKVFTASAMVKAEFRHPILGNLFGTILISLLLLPILLVAFSPLLARIMWVTGAVGMLVFAWLIVTRWMSERQQLAHATPAWIVPVVGLLDVPLAMPSLGLPPMPGVMMASLAIGLFFTLPLFTLILMRLVFEPPLPNALAPSLVILVAPFAVGTSTYVVTTGHVDGFAQSLFALAVFILAVVIGRLRHLVGCCPFKVSWWAVGFPLAASAIAALRLASADPGMIVDGLAVILLALASVVMTGLLVRTLIGVARGEMRVMSQ